MKHISSIVLASLVSAFSLTASAADEAPKHSAKHDAKHAQHQSAHPSKHGVHKVSHHGHKGHASHSKDAKPSVVHVSSHKSHEGKSHEGKSHEGKSHEGKSHEGKSHEGKSHATIVKASTKHEKSAIDSQVTLHLGVAHAETHEEPKDSDLAFPDISLAKSTKDDAKLKTEEHRKAESAMLSKVSFKGHEKNHEKGSKAESSEGSHKSQRETTHSKGGSGRTPRAQKPAKQAAPTKSDDVPEVQPLCFSDLVEFRREGEVDTFPLSTCDGKVTEEAERRLTKLAVPTGVAERKELLSKKATLEPALLERVAKIVGHFAKKHPGKLQVEIVSGIHPNAKGSFHAAAKALDFRIVGVANEEMVAVCKSMKDTGCGYYPNSTFIHVDAREPGSGPIAWIDASKPGEAPRYVKSWPEPSSDKPSSDKPSQEPVKDLPLASELQN
jgi:Bacterial protein of unknown function (DUF882)